MPGTVLIGLGPVRASLAVRGCSMPKQDWIFQAWFGCGCCCEEEPASQDRAWSSRIHSLALNDARMIHACACAPQNRGPDGDTLPLRVVSEGAKQRGDACRYMLSRVEPFWLLTKRHGKRDMSMPMGFPSPPACNSRVPVLTYLAACALMYYGMIKCRRYLLCTMILLYTSQAPTCPCLGPACILFSMTESMASHRLLLLTVILVLYVSSFALLFGGESRAIWPF